jgi:hypothetical protein
MPRLLRKHWLTKTGSAAWNDLGLTSIDAEIGLHSASSNQSSPHPAIRPEYRRSIQPFNGFASNVDLVVAL